MTAQKQSTSGRKGKPARAGHGELELTAMVDVHNVVARSHRVAVVAVKWAAVVVSTTYGDDESRWREVRGAMVVAGHGRA